MVERDEDLFPLGLFSGLVVFQRVWAFCLGRFGSLFFFFRLVVLEGYYHHYWYFHGVARPGCSSQNYININI